MGLQIFHVEKDERFDLVTGDRFKGLVQPMLCPGFYVYSSVFKCGKGGLQTLQQRWEKQ